MFLQHYYKLWLLFPIQCRLGRSILTLHLPDSEQERDHRPLTFGTDSQAYTIQVTVSNLHGAAAAKFLEIVVQCSHQPKEHIFSHSYG